MAISQGFVDRLAGMGADPARLHAIPNWAPLDELPRLAKDNPWSRARGLHESFNVLYSGSLGLKHNPSVLSDLARSFGAVSEGPGADWLGRQRDRLRIANLVLLPFQAMEALPQVLAAADVLAGVLEPGAGRYSVPSKVLSYLCAGRPIVLAMPEQNPAVELVLEAAAGVAVPPGDSEAFIAAVRALQHDPRKREQMGMAGRRFAENRFDVERIADRFEAVLEMAVAARAGTDAPSA